MRSHGTGMPGALIRYFLTALFWVRDRCVCTVVIEHDGRRLLFKCRSRRALRRATTLLIKEQGTIAWLTDQLREGDIFLDIGANVGIYSIFAANRVGESGHVYAIEPHILNAIGLLENVAVNDLSERVSVLTSALASTEGFQSFNYRDWEIGSSFSQLGGVTGEMGRPFEPVARERKHAITVDGMVERGVIRVPDLIKLDVDGLEPAIIRGMRRLLQTDRRPRAIQIEVSSANQAEIGSIMREFGYMLRLTHFTSAGKKQLKRGAEAANLDHNAIYIPAVPASKEARDAGPADASDLAKSPPVTASREGLPTQP